MDPKDIRKTKVKKGQGHLYSTYNYYPGHINTERIAYFDHPITIVVAHIKIDDKHGKYWNDTKEVLLDAVYKGYNYRMALDKFKSERSLFLRINNFVKYIVNDTKKD